MHLHLVKCQVKKKKEKNSEHKKVFLTVYKFKTVIVTKECSRIICIEFVVLYFDLL